MKSVAELGLYYLTVLAVLGCLIRLGAIGRILRDFREARGPLWELRNTVDALKELEPAIRSLGNQVALVDEKVESARKQVAELQVESISTRSDTDDSVDQVGGSETPIAVVEGENKNWLSLREYWQRNRKRIEYVIDNIPDGRTKLAYDRLPRTHYRRILDKLQGQGLITEAAGNASRQLNDLFNRFRPRNRTIPDEVVDSLVILDEQLERELVPFTSVLAAENGDTLTVPQAATPTGETTSSITAASSSRPTNQISSEHRAT